MTDSMGMLVRGLWFSGSCLSSFIRWWQLYFSQVIKFWHIYLRLRIILWLFHYPWSNSQSQSRSTRSTQRNFCFHGKILSEEWDALKNLVFSFWDFWNGSLMLGITLLHQCISEHLSSFTDFYEKYFILWHVLNGCLEICYTFTKHCTTVEMLKACYTRLTPSF